MSDSSEFPALSRRSLIRRSAAIGAAAWTAPVIIDSLASPAAAVTAAACSGAPQFVDFRTGTTSSATTSAVVVRPTGTFSTDVLIVGLMYEKGNDVTITAPSGWTLIRNRKHPDPDTGTVIGMATYWKREAGTPANYSFGFSQSVKWAIGISQWACASAAVNPINASSGNSGASGTATATGISTTVNNCAVLCFFTSKKTTAWGTVSGAEPPVERYDATSTDQSNMMASFTKVTLGATGDRTSTATDDSGGEWIAQQVALLPA